MLKFASPLSHHVSSTRSQEDYPKCAKVGVAEITGKWYDSEKIHLLYARRCGGNRRCRFPQISVSNLRFSRLPTPEPIHVDVFFPDVLVSVCALV